MSPYKSKLWLIYWNVDVKKNIYSLQRKFYLFHNGFYFCSFIFQIWSQCIPMNSKQISSLLSIMNTLHFITVSGVHNTPPGRKSSLEGRNKIFSQYTLRMEWCSHQDFFNISKFINWWWTYALKSLCCEQTLHFTIQLYDVSFQWGRCSLSETQVHKKSENTKDHNLNS